MECRSWNMSRIKGKNTKPEILVRSLLHKMGYRFRLHVKNLPGRPDIVLPKYKTAIFVHGCSTTATAAAKTAQLWPRVPHRNKTDLADPLLDDLAGSLVRNTDDTLSGTGALPLEQNQR